MERAQDAGEQEDDKKHRGEAIRLSDVKGFVGTKSDQETGCA